MNSMKRQKTMTLKDKPPRSEGVQYTIGEEQRNHPRKATGYYHYNNDTAIEDSTKLVITIVAQDG